jgi:hypothetical protein
MVSNFQTGNKRIKLLTEYESVAQKVVPLTPVGTAKCGVQARWCTPPHWAYIVREFLDMHFSWRWFERHEPIPWLLRSLHIMPLGFFLWGYVKGIVYKTPVTSPEELKLRIAAAIENYTTNAGDHLEGN